MPDYGRDKRTVKAEREALELRKLLSEAVEWARRPSPIPIVPFQDFLDRAAAACGRNCTGKAAREWLELIGETPNRSRLLVQDRTTE